MLRESVADAGLADRTYFVVVSDHGFAPIALQPQPNAVLRTEGLLTWTRAAAVTRSDAYSHAEGGADPNAEFGGPAFIPGRDTIWFWRARATVGGTGSTRTCRVCIASFIMAGPAVRGRGYVGVMRMTQIAPTLAKFLGVDLGPETDTPVTGIRGTPR